MADKTNIAWTGATWNPVTGCSKVSAGCKHCYAERDWVRLKHLPVYVGREFTDVACHQDRLDQPLRWKRPRMVFVNSMSDLFHECVPNEFIDQVFAVMALSKQHVFQVLTKRPERMLRYMHRLGRSAQLLDKGARSLGYTLAFEGRFLVSWPIPNVWLGVSVEDQRAADERIPLLLQAPAAVRWVSAEPLLGSVDLERILWPGKSHRVDVLRGGYWNKEGVLALGSSVDIGERKGGFTNHSDFPSTLDWVVCGGESGARARLTHPDWARLLRDQCKEAGVPFFFKQTGLWQPLAPGEANLHEWQGRETKFEMGVTFVKTKGGGSDLLDGQLLQSWPSVGPF